MAQGVDRGTGRAVSFLAFACVALLAITPAFGWPPVTRVSVVLLTAFCVLLAITRPWRASTGTLDQFATWSPSATVVWLAAIVSGALLLWFVLSRFYSGAINAIDFTVYYDRPTYQTAHGRLMYVESADDPVRAYQTYLSVHAHWVMIPLSFVYRVYPSPLWLLVLSVVAVVVGAVYTFRILQFLVTVTLLAAAAGLAFMLNDNTARTLIYGFHTEVLYAWFAPWALHAALTRRPWSFGVAALGCIAVKEDAFMVLAAVSVSLALLRFRAMSPWERVLYLAAPTAAALVNVVVYYGYLLPELRPAGSFYANYWGSFGSTPRAAALGMLTDPWRVVSLTATSGFFLRVLLPHLFLPLAGWRWMGGVLPIVFLYGASDNEQMRDFGIYYAIVLVPFLVLASAEGVARVGRLFLRDPRVVQVAGAIVLVAGSLVGGLTSGGYSLRPWKPAVLEVAGTIDRLLETDARVLVQSGLYPHAGYDSRVQLLTPETLSAPANNGAFIVVAPTVGAWPLSGDDLRSLIASSTRVESDQADAALVVLRLTK